MISPVWNDPIARARLMETALDTIPSGVMLLDEAGVIVYANQALLDGFGYSQLEGEPLVTLVPDWARAKHVEGFEGFLRSPAVDGPVCVKGRHRDGREIDVEVSVSYSRAYSRIIVCASCRVLES